MSDVEIHARIAREKRAAAHNEFTAKRYTAVGDLTIKAVEQAIEAAAAHENKHFHSHPRSAHSSRMSWIGERFPSLFKDVSELWAAYGSLGYEGIDGERAKKALEAMERVMDGIDRKTGLGLKRPS